MSGKKKNKEENLRLVLIIFTEAGLFSGPKLKYN